MKKYLLIFLLLIISIGSNAQSGNNRIKLGGQMTLTPYLLQTGYGYQGEYEYTLGDRYSVSIGIGQATAKDESTFRSSGTVNGVSYAYNFSIPAREGISYLDFSFFTRLFRRSKKNHFKIGSGLTFQSIWVEYTKDANVVGGVVQEIDLEKQIKNIVMANFNVQNDFYLTPQIFLNTKLSIKTPIGISEDTSFERSVQYTSAAGFGGGRNSSNADLNITATFIFGLGYRF